MWQLMQAGVTLTRIHAAKLNVLWSCRIYVCFLLRLFSLVTLYILYSGYVLVIHMRRIDMKTIKKTMQKTKIHPSRKLLISRLYWLVHSRECVRCVGIYTCKNWLFYRNIKSLWNPYRKKTKIHKRSRERKQQEKRRRLKRLSP
jgi:hypothetical protein